MATRDEHATGCPGPLCVLAACCLLSLLASAPATPARGAETRWQHDPATAGDWFDPNNWTDGVPAAGWWAYIDNGGQAQIANGVAEADSLRISYPDGGASRAVLDATGALRVHRSLMIGTGAFTQDGGSNIAQDLYIGGESGPEGTYSLNGGSVSAETLRVGEYGPGRFLQRGGSAAAGDLSVGRDGAGTYELSGTGQLSVGTGRIGWFSETPGVFRQSGGTHTAGYLRVCAPGRYEFTGGSWQIAGGLRNEGTVDFQGRPVSVEWDGLIVDCSQGSLANAESASMSLGANSLLIIPAGFDPAAAFGSFHSSGIVHTVGTPLTVPAGRGFAGWGTIGDYVHCQGTITAADDGSVDLEGGLALSATGRVDLGEGELRTEHAETWIEGGALTSAEQYVGDGAVCTQTGGENVVRGPLYVRDLSGSGGVYQLSGGALTAESISLCRYGQRTPSPGAAGTFCQTGGTLQADHLSIGAWLSRWGSPGTFIQSRGAAEIHSGLHVGVGSYQLSGGATLSAQTEIIGCGLNLDEGGRFEQTGGSNTVEYLHVAATGRYDLLGGKLRITAGLRNDGTFNFAGRTTALDLDHVVMDLAGGQVVNADRVSLRLGPHSLLIMPAGFDPHAVFGTFQCDGFVHTPGGMLTVPADRGFGGWGAIEGSVQCQGTIAASPGGRIDIEGGLNVSGGSVDLGPGELHIKDATSGLEDGRLSCWRQYVGYYSDGTFTQTGGTSTVFELQVGFGAAGTYCLDGGTFAAEAVHVGLADLREGTLRIASPAADVTVSDVLHFHSLGVLTAVPGSCIRMTGARFRNDSTDPAALAGLSNAALLFEGGDLDRGCLEVAGADRGANLEGFHENFALGSLILGGGEAGGVRLVDDFDNQPSWEGAEAAYVENLTIAAGSVLDLNGLNLYYLQGDIQFGAVIVGGWPVCVLAALVGDASGDGIVNVGDLGILGAHYGCTDATWAEGDFDGDGAVTSADLSILMSHYSPAGSADPGSAAAVPEPATLVLLCGAAVPLLLRGRRRPGRKARWIGMA